MCQKVTMVAFGTVHQLVHFCMKLDIYICWLLYHLQSHILSRRDICIINCLELCKVKRRRNHAWSCGLFSV